MDETFMEALEAFGAHLKKTMGGSAAYVGVVTKSFLADPVCAVQLGVALQIDKPIYLLAEKGLIIPSNILKIAKAMILFDRDDPASIKAASDKLMKHAEEELHAPRS